MTSTLSLSSEEKLGIISNLGTLLTAAVPIMEAVDSLIEDSKGSQRKILETLKKDLSQGRSISFSFSQFPRAFDPVTVHLIGAAEQAGTLDTSLKDLSQAIKKDIALADRIKSALVYPAMISFVFVGVILVILVFVIPRIAMVFGRLKTTLPLPTKILVISSNILLSYAPILIGILAFLVAFSLYLYRKHKPLFFSLFFSLPILKALAGKIDLARFSRTLSLLLSAGIPIDEALEICQYVVTKKEVADTIKQAKKMVMTGKSMSEAFNQAKTVIPRVITFIIEAGERSGTLEQAMQEISDYMEEQVTTTIKVLLDLFEPSLLVIMGLVVGAMMLAIIAPIYQLIGSISIR